MNIKYSKTILSNGLKVIFHNDPTTPMAAFNLLYNVGARDENPERTGLAHLFEHLMFGGSKNAPIFDTPLQIAGGENNAFTSNDITNYYITIPKSNIETAFWLESDRMTDLDISERALNIQRKVVIEEFNQRYLNQPYGDVSLIMRPLSYKVHPYQWSTIGKNTNHIAETTQKEARDFYNKFYSPSNAILVVAGDFKEDYIFNLAEKWFGDIKNRNYFSRNLPLEPLQKEARKLIVEKDVSQDKIIIGFPMCDRLHKDYHAFDILTDVLSQGISNRLHLNLVKKKEIFSSIDAYISGSLDPGQIMFNGDVMPNISISQAEEEIWNEIESLKQEGISDNELNKSFNQIETSFMFQNVSILNRAMNLAMYELLGNIELINTEIDLYKKLKPQDIQNIALKTLIPEFSTSLHYLSKSKKINNKL